MRGTCQSNIAGIQSVKYIDIIGKKPHL